MPGLPRYPRAVSELRDRSHISVIKNIPTDEMVLHELQSNPVVFFMNQRPLMDGSLTTDLLRFSFFTKKGNLETELQCK